MFHSSRFAWFDFAAGLSAAVPLCSVDITNFAVAQVERARLMKEK